MELVPEALPLRVKQTEREPDQPQLVPGQGSVDLPIHFPIRLHGLVLS
jgi:hypothetical protein